jgi:thiosulfate dehydrogenase [quinone] large subunit
MATTNIGESAFGTDTSFELSGPWATYWIGMLRVITGWWFFHAGFTKLITDGLNYSYGPMYLQGMGDTVVGPLATWLGYNAGWFVAAMVPLGETLIGLGLMFGVLVRLASFFGAFFMTLFWVGNAGFAHGVVNGDFMGLLLFVTMIVLGAGRYYGLDAYLERTKFVKQRPTLKYLLG